MENERIVILVADRNRHIRDLLQRVLGAEGYQVKAAGDGREVLAILDGENPPNLLVLDLEIPFLSVQLILQRLKNRTSPLPVIIHTFLTERADELETEHEFAVVEKTGDTDRLRTAIDEMAYRFFPDRYASRRQTSFP